MTMLATIVMFILSPRFIISVRELYVDNLLRMSGESMGVDTGFGIGKSPSSLEESSVGFTTTGIPEDDVELEIR